MSSELPKDEPTKAAECPEKVISLPENCPEFLDQLLHKCEVTNYADMYRKLLKINNGLVRCENLFAKDPKKSIDRILETTKPISDIIVVFLFDPRVSAINSKNNSAQFEKIPYIVNPEGFSRVLFNYRREKFLGNTISMEGMDELFGIDSGQTPKFHTMIDQMIKSRNIYAEKKEIKDNTPGSPLKQIIQFQRVRDVPEKRKLLYQLIIAIAIFLTAIILFGSFYFKNL